MILARAMDTADGLKHLYPDAAVANSARAARQILRKIYEESFYNTAHTTCIESSLRLGKAQSSRVLYVDTICGA